MVDYIPICVICDNTMIEVDNDNGYICPICDPKGWKDYMGRIYEQLQIDKKERQMAREQVYKAIDSEREYQDSMDGVSEAPSVASELILLEEYVGRARNTFTETFGDPEEQPTMNVIRKIAGIATRAMENHGAPNREK